KSKSVDAPPATAAAAAAAGPNGVSCNSVTETAALTAAAETTATAHWSSTGPFGNLPSEWWTVEGSELYNDFESWMEAIRGMMADITCSVSNVRGRLQSFRRRSLSPRHSIGSSRDSPGSRRTSLLGLRQPSFRDQRVSPDPASQQLQRRLSAAGASHTDGSDSAIDFASETGPETTTDLHMDSSQGPGSAKAPANRGDPNAPVIVAGQQLQHDMASGGSSSKAFGPNESVLSGRSGVAAQPARAVHVKLGLQLQASLSGRALQPLQGASSTRSGALSSFPSTSRRVTSSRGPVSAAGAQEPRTEEVWARAAAAAATALTLRPVVERWSGRRGPSKCTEPVDLTISGHSKGSSSAGGGGSGGPIHGFGAHSGGREPLRSGNASGKQRVGGDAGAAAVGVIVGGLREASDCPIAAGSRRTAPDSGAMEAAADVPSAAVIIESAKSTGTAAAASCGSLTSTQPGVAECSEHSEVPELSGRPLEPKFSSGTHRPPSPGGPLTSNISSGGGGGGGFISVAAKLTGTLSASRAFSTVRSDRNATGLIPTAAHVSLSTRPSMSSVSSICGGGGGAPRRQSVLLYGDDDTGDGSVTGAGGPTGGRDDAYADAFGSPLCGSESSSDVSATAPPAKALSHGGSQELSVETLSIRPARGAPSAIAITSKTTNATNATNANANVSNSVVQSHSWRHTYRPRSAAVVP
ncbi:hypothetical protein Vretimale_3459, partial [Volvox reticuliferus]